MQVRELFPQVREPFPQVREPFPEVRELFPQVRELLPQVREFFPQVREFFPQVREPFPQVIFLFLQMAKKSNIQDIYALSPMQEGMLFHALRDPRSSAYFEQMVIEVNEKINIRLFETAFNKIIQRYDILRTQFTYKKTKKPRQVVLKERTADVHFEDITHLPPGEKDSYLEGYRQEDRAKGFDLSRDLLMRAAVFKMEQAWFRLVWSFHHILMDGWCFGILFKEFMQIYGSLKNKQSLRMEPAVPYRIYIEWLERQDRKKGLNYWREYLAGYEQQAVIPTWETPLASGGYLLQEEYIILDDMLTRRLEKTARDNRATFNTLVQTLWGLLVQRYNNIDDVVFGAVVSGRPAEIRGIETMMGLFINTVPVRVKTFPGQRFSSLLQQMQQMNSQSKSHEYLPLAEVQSLSPLKHRLITHIIGFQNYPLKAAGTPAQSVKALEFFEQTNYDFNIIVSPGNGLLVKFSCNARVYDRGFIKQVGKHLERLAKQAADFPNIPVEEIDILSAQEKEQLLCEFNNTHISYPGEKLLHRLFEEQAAKTPDSTAVLCAEQLQITYYELNKKADQVAEVLREKGVLADDIVAIMMERSVEMIIDILGILKTGGAYLPIDPDYPEERKQYMLADSNARVLLTNLSEGHHFHHSSLITHHSGNLAYVIYTSGSTGQPKAVGVEHRSVVNTLVYRRDAYQMDASVVSLQLFSYAFDGFITSFFTPVAAGGRVNLPDSRQMKDIFNLNAVIARHAVTHFIAVPSLYQAMLEYMTPMDAACLKVVTLAGERVSPHLLESTRRLNPGVEVVNEYGVSEAAVMSTIYRNQQKDAVIKIGRPVANTAAFVFDSQYRLQPVGIAGELCIEGAGLGRGYLNNPELTSDKFIFVSYKSYRSYRTYIPKKIYKTGDLARWLPDGNLQYVGRKDQQMKIRGFRIEPGEIENRLLTHKKVNEAYVTAGNGNSLYAYIAAAQGIKPGISELREFLAAELPTYMIPGYFMFLEKIPFTASGKVDRSALPKPEEVSIGQYTAPRDEIEETLVQIWTEILGRSVGIDDDFFEIGGHSLRATTLTARIRKELDVEVPVGQVFADSTIRSLGEFIKNASVIIYKSIQPIEKREYYPQSSAQKRLYFVDKFDTIGTSYNVFNSLIMQGEPELQQFHNIFSQLIERHESFRTSFATIGSQQVQRVHDVSDISFEIEYSNLAAEERKPPTISDFVRPFDLEQAPLLRAGLVKISAKEYLLLFDMHHIICDGTSMGILTDEFFRLYHNEELPPFRVQYKDFCCWQNRLFATGKIKCQEDYWLSIYGDGSEIPRLDLPTDYPRPEVFSFEGEQFHFQAPPPVTAAFNLLSSQMGVTLYMNLMAALNTLLYKYTGQTDIIVGTGMMGRPHADLHPIIGMFINTLALRNHPCGSKTYRQFLKEVKERSIKAFDNQDLQFETLIDMLNLERDPSRNPLFDIMFAVQNFEMPFQEDKTQHQPQQRLERKTAKFDLTLFAYEVGDEILFKMEYCTRLFKPAAIRRISSYLVNVMQIAAEKPDIRLADIDILTSEEKQRILNDFNDTETPYPGNKTIYQLFAEQVERIPDGAALVGPGLGQKDHVTITYNELNEKSRQLACYLQQEWGIGAGEPVGILMDRSFDMIAAILGILQAGGAYLPLDPSFPLEPLKNMIRDASIGVVISEKKYINTLNRLQWECPSFRCFLCMDSYDVYAEQEGEKSELMSRKLWNYVAESASDDITGGGWLSSYTGEPISREEMDEYGGNALLKLKPLLRPDMKVLEIGCASGITMKRIAPYVGLYYGTDLSVLTLEKNKQWIKEAGMDHIHFYCLAAHDIDKIEETGFDLVIINSVIQCFHGHNYLRKVLRKVIDKIGEGGYLFIGDIMDQEMKDRLVKDLTAFKLAHREDGYKTKIDWSAELFISKDFFNDLVIEIPVIERVEFSDKIYSIENELTRYRYDALLTIDKTRQKERSKKAKRKYQHDLAVLERYAGINKPATVQSGASAGHIAYIMYTSGSTGKPKGILTTHANVIRVVKNTDYIAITWRDRVLQLSNYAFDGSVFDIYGALLNGAVLVMVNKEDLLGVERLAEIIHNKRITLFFVTTALFNTMVDLEIESFAHVRKILFGGERVSVEHAAKASEYLGENRILHVYGPTETTVYASWHPINRVNLEAVTIPIGKPISNTVIYILDRDMNPVPVGVNGEIYIGGAGTACGYLNQPELTSDKFFSISNKSYRSYRTYIPKKIYKTGDLGRWLEDGSIEFFGRMDQQVKIRGFRIELGEIEARLLSHEDIREAVVITREHPGGERYICAYVVPENPDEELDMGRLRERLALEMPDYMVPAYLVPMDCIPLTPNGKINRKALPEPTAIVRERFTAPRDEVEKGLAGIWSEILNIPAGAFGIDDNFFEMGGHSLKATVLISKIHKALNVKVPLAEVFKTPSVRGLSNYIKGMVQDRFVSIEPVEDREYYPVSSAQKRLYIQQQLDADNIHYNMPAVVVLEGVLGTDRLETTFKRLIDRHESLRTGFLLIRGEPVQQVHQEVDFEIEYYSAAEDTDKIISAFVRPFDLSGVPLLRLGLIKIEEYQHNLMFDMHHIISDGESLGLFEREFMTVYSAEELAPLRLQYRDYSQWQNRAPETFKTLENYWLSQFEDVPEPLNLPLDFPRPAHQGFKGDTIGFTIEAAETQALDEIARSVHATRFMILFSIYTILLSRVTGQEDIVVGTPVAGRRHADLGPIMGMFVNTLVLRTRPSGEKPFAQFLEEVRDKTLAAFENQDYTFEDLVDQLSRNVPGEDGRNPLFDVMFALRNLDMPEIKIPGLSLKPYPYKKDTSLFDMTLTAMDSAVGGEDRLVFTIEYNTALFKAATIERFISYFTGIVRTVIANKHIPLQDIFVSHGLRQVKSHNPEMELEI